MEPTAVDLLAPVHRLTVDEYQRMAEAEVFSRHQHVELIDGVVVDMSAMGIDHVRAVMWLQEWLTDRRPEAVMVATQLDIVLRPLRSQPQPDLALVGLEDIRQGLAEQPLLVVEVSVSSLRFDQVVKAQLYARHGLRDYWIVNLVDDVIEVHREPHPDGTWGSRRCHGSGDDVAPLALPGTPLEVAALLRFAHHGER